MKCTPAIAAIALTSVLSGSLPPFQGILDPGQVGIIWHDSPGNLDLGVASVFRSSQVNSPTGLMKRQQQAANPWFIEVRVPSGQGHFSSNIAFFRKTSNHGRLAARATGRSGRSMNLG